MTTASTLHLKNFQCWIRDPINLLLREKHTGFAVAMIAFPVLERWIRGKVGINDRSLRGRDGDLFYGELAMQFPVLADLEDAKAFWRGFRDGILHQATFSAKPIEVLNQRAYFGFADLSGEPIRKTASPPTFHVDPPVFAREVLSIVEKDFAAYEASDPPLYELATDVADTTAAWSAQTIPPMKVD